MYFCIIAILLVLLTTHVVSTITTRTNPTTTTTTTTTPIRVDLIQRSVDCQLLAELDHRFRWEQVNPSCEGLSVRIKERVSQYCDDQLVHFPAARQAPQLVYLSQPIQKKVRWADSWVDSDLGSMDHFDLSDVEISTIPDSEIPDLEYQHSWEEFNSQW
ncbi:hypothetical protein BGX38DRAFT_459554 [Terfezia claveryi]|nr:hypothetical protein BGX38DRAFT_459554 [Terfezia claveryi]